MYFEKYYQKCSQRVNTKYSVKHFEINTLLVVCCNGLVPGSFFIQKPCINLLCVWCDLSLQYLTGHLFRKNAYFRNHSRLMCIIMDCDDMVQVFSQLCCGDTCQILEQSIDPYVPGHFKTNWNKHTRAYWIDYRSWLQQYDAFKVRLDHSYILLVQCTARRPWPLLTGAMKYTPMIFQQWVFIK